MRYRMILFSTRNTSKLYEERLVCRRETGLFSTTNELNIYKICQKQLEKKRSLPANVIKYDFFFGLFPYMANFYCSTQTL